MLPLLNICRVPYLRKPHGAHINSETINEAPKLKARPN